LADERLHLALQMAAMATWEWDLTTGGVTLSEESASLFGASSGGIEDLKALMHPADVPATRLAVGRALRGEIPYALEFRIVMPDSRIRWVAVRGDVKRNAGGTPLRVVGVCADVSAQRQAEARLARDALILQNVRESVIVTDLQGIVTYWNRGAEDLLGWTESEMLGRPLVERYPAAPPPIRAGAAQLLERIAAGEEFTGEVEAYRRDGTRVWIETRMRLLLDAGRPAGIVEVSRDITQRKRAERALRLSESRYRSLVEQAPISIQTFAPDGVALQANAAWARLWGADLQDLTGYNILHDRQLERCGVMPFIRRAFAGEAVTIPPTWYDPAEERVGRARWVEAHLYPRLSDSGELREVVLMLRDVTDQVEAESRIRRGQERYESLIMASTQVVWNTAADGSVLEDLPTWRAFTGQTREELHAGGGWGWTSCIHPDDREDVQATWRAALAAQQPHEQEFRVHARDGSWRHMLARALPVKESDGSIREWVGTLTDITEQRRAQEALRAREREFKTVVENARDVIVRFDRECRHLYINPIIEEITGIPAASFIGRTNRELGLGPPAAHEGAGDLWECAIREVFSTGQERSIEFSHFGPGGLRHFQSRLVPEFAPADDQERGGKGAARAVETVMAITRDLTERRLAEERLARKAAELARSNAELESFAYIASHDLKEPLRGIANYAHFLLEDYHAQLDDEGKHKLLTLKNLAARMDRLLDALLEFSRVGRTELAFDDTDLGAIVRDVLLSLGPRLEELGVRTTIHPLPTLRCDRVRVREVLSNLVTNAFKYNQRPEKIIEIGHLADAPETIYVRDNGIGIPPQHQDKLFRMFKRLHGRDKYGGGTGSGLAIAKRIVERHGGRIWLESRPGEGTTFFFTLPQSRENGQTPSLRC
jgi:PAS domain S-box-containing protein